jgi:hypothetical protein
MSEETLKRTCANCACHDTGTYPLTQQEMMVCKRNPPNGIPMRVQRPSIDPITKQVRMAKRADKPTPIMEEVQTVVVFYNPTSPDMTCFDGWRPMGTEPGDFAYKSNVLEKQFEKTVAGMNRLLDDMATDVENTRLADPSKKN